MQRIKRARPMLNHVIVTADRYEATQIKNGIVDISQEEGEIKDIQRIVAVGPGAYEDLNVGDTVLINPLNYSRPVHSLREGSVLEKDKDEVEMVVSWPIVDIDGKECLFIYDRDIDMIIDEFMPDEDDGE